MAVGQVSFHSDKKVRKSIVASTDWSPDIDLQVQVKRGAFGLRKVDIYIDMDQAS